MEPRTTTGDDRMHEIVRRNLSKITGDALTEDVSIRVDSPLATQNPYSKRAGARITLTRGVDQYEYPIWAKRVNDPARAFERMRYAYEVAHESGISDVIPEPYFYDVESRLVFMELAAGRPLRRMTLAYVTVGYKPENVILPLAYNRIGRWLGKYNLVATTGETMYLPDFIEQMRSTLHTKDCLTRKELALIDTRLKEALNVLSLSHNIPLVWPHNDFTLRNFLIESTSRFTILDWDAMAHPEYADQMAGWWDVTLFLVNLHSLSRFSPLVRRGQLTSLCSAFVRGYLEGQQEPKLFGGDRGVRLLLYLFTLRFWLGIGIDRPLNKIYSKSLGGRYSRALERKLLSGRTDFFPIQLD